MSDLPKRYTAVWHGDAWNVCISRDGVTLVKLTTDDLPVKVSKGEVSALALRIASLLNDDEHKRNPLQYASGDPAWRTGKEYETRTADLLELWEKAWACLRSNTAEFAGFAEEWRRAPFQYTPSDLVRGDGGEYQGGGVNAAATEPGQGHYKIYYQVNGDWPGVRSAHAFTYDHDPAFDLDKGMPVDTALNLINRWNATSQEYLYYLTPVAGMDPEPYTGKDRRRKDRNATARARLEKMEGRIGVKSTSKHGRYYRRFYYSQRGYPGEHVLFFSSDQSPAFDPARGMPEKQAREIIAGYNNRGGGFHHFLKQAEET